MTHYNITCVGKPGKGTEAKSIPGYIFSFGGGRYGVTNKQYNEAGEIVTGGGWKITELTTGFICYGKYARTKREAVDGFIKALAGDANGYKATIEQAISRYFEKGNKDANPGLIPKNEILIARGTIQN